MAIKPISEQGVASNKLKEFFTVNGECLLSDETLCTLQAEGFKREKNNDCECFEYSEHPYILVKHIGWNADGDPVYVHIVPKVIAVYEDNSWTGSTTVEHWCTEREFEEFYNTLRGYVHEVNTEKN